MAFQSRVYLRPMASDNYRALANNMYGAGADGVSSFNFMEQYTGNLIGLFPGELALLKEPAWRSVPRTFGPKSVWCST